MHYCYNNIIFSIKLVTGLYVITDIHLKKFFGLSLQFSYMKVIDLYILLTWQLTITTLSLSIKCHFINFQNYHLHNIKFNVHYISTSYLTLIWVATLGSPQMPHFIQSTDQLLCFLLKVTATLKIPYQFIQEAFKFVDHIIMWLSFV